MNRELLETAARLVEGAVKRGAQGARASAYRSHESTVEWRDGKLDRLQDSTQKGATVTLFVDGRYSSNTTCDLRPEALARFLDEGVAMTRVLAVDPHRHLPDPKHYAARFDGDLRLYDTTGHAELTPDVRRSTTQQLEEAVRTAPGAEALISVTTACSNSETESVVVASNGLQVGRQVGDFSISAEASVRDQGDRKPEGSSYGATTERSALPSIAWVGADALARGLALRGSAPQKSGQYACVVENRVASRLLRDILQPLNGQAIQQQRSYLAGKLGERLFSQKLTIIDEPLLQAGLASRPYDGEGMTRQRLPLIDKGVVRAFLLDTYYASKLNLAPTTGSTTNLVFERGTQDLAGLLETMGTGILITGFSGGNSNSATGDFSLGIRGQWIERGKPVRAVSEMNLAGNHLQFWKELAEVGNDPFSYASIQAPSLRFGAVQFSGL